MMKISAAALLALVAQSGAFTAPSPATRSTTALNSFNPNGTMQKTMNSPAPATAAGKPMKAGQAGKVVKVQGNSLKTWGFLDPRVERVSVKLETEGRPLNADVELWQGPDNTPVKMRVYIENGAKRPFNAVVETPRGPNTIAVRNIGQMEFPMDAQVLSVDGGAMAEGTDLRTIQGGALRTYPFDPLVDSVEIVLKTDGRPLNALIELLQGPNNKKKVIEIYTEDGMDRPFTAIIETPGSGNVIRVVNTSPVEFPLVASVQPYEVGKVGDYGEPVLGGDSDAAMATTISQW
eukprot:CAMPEP_0198141786 /NCGR_PEP_ID=MMETSP1443-20131203/4724_1 /TAXON_ID=186043 /ORGANISM="Entomoneis sp., Strain CCMP2396" /LENGTH=290 /DNA_ID=CAMNT_0043804625 /DNA_START=45 /DNA_END=917 /DNA_ORIENTATION=+